MRTTPIFNIFYSATTTLLLSTVLAGCGGSSSGDPASDNNSNTGNGDSSVSTDITNVNFSKSSGDCRDYVGSYRSQVRDENRSMVFNGQVTISATDNSCSIASNEIPNHNFHDGNARFATNVSEQSGSYSVTRNPQAAAQTTELSLGATNVIFLNGVTADLLAAACYGVGNEPLGREKIGCGQNQINNPWRYDPMSSLNNFGTDSHNAHAQPDGTYHYHGNPMAMFNQSCESDAQVSPVIGFAADGFPVFGPCINDNGTVRKARSSYQLKSGARQAVSGYQTPVSSQGDVASGNYDGQFRGDYQYSAASGDLDECNGMTVNGQYGYYLTDSYPWIIGCYRGSVSSSFSRAPAAFSRHSHDASDPGYHSHDH
ncbi:YHYH protein [Bacterioplanoides sp.]|uniref:YHYH protein n=1 Tax=Bacterioplanoides sp. TaxID=2066072 RepID=UPI003B5B194A